ncbi:P-loop NTPase [Cupriavidus basilensis]
MISWVVKDLESLERNTGPLEAVDAIAYFDGATPTWRIALSESIPRREIVSRIAGKYHAESNVPIVCALLAAGCEGKTTALLQASLEILRNDRKKKILFRTNHTRKFDSRELADTLHTIALYTSQRPRRPPMKRLPSMIRELRL